MLTKPLLIEDLDKLRSSILPLTGEDGKRGMLWRMLKNCARSSPMSYPWFTPFVALITNDEQDIKNAKAVIRAYLDKLEPMSFCSGLQMHFWCFAFPHAKWAVYFQWLCSIGAYSEEEKREISETFVKYHFINFYYGLGTKPDPECVDNQTLSLALSTAIIGYIFSDESFLGSSIAKLMYRDGLKRLPHILGSMPASGYTGEGSAYMDCVIAAATFMTVEFLQIFTKKQGLIYEPFAPNGVKPVKMLDMIANERMPGGLLMPWDNYGYQHGTRSGLAYAANRTGSSFYLDMLENHTNLAFDVGTGWAFDDLGWTLIWWPLSSGVTHTKEQLFFEPDVMGTLRSKSGDRYIAQIWDESAPNIPTRCHVNPGMVLFNGYNTPLSADGSPSKEGCERFNFEDTYREVGFMAIGQTVKYNYGNGCAGAHSVMIVDGWEGMRAFSDYKQTKDSSADWDNLSLTCDVTPLYAEAYTDTKRVIRKSRLHCDSFFTIEDLAEFENTHTVTSRFVLRPRQKNCTFGVKLETPEGITLHLFDLQNQSEVSTEQVEGFPEHVDGECMLADFTKKGSTVRRLTAAFISRTREIMHNEYDFLCIPDSADINGYNDAVRLLDSEGVTVPLNMPAFIEAGLSVVPGWWYKKRITKRKGKAYLVLPGGYRDARLWIDGQEIVLPVYTPYTTLIRAHVELPAETMENEQFELVFFTTVPVSHYEGDEHGALVSIWGGFALAYDCPEEEVLSYGYDGRTIRIKTNVREYNSEYGLME